MPALPCAFPEMEGMRMNRIAGRSGIVFLLILLMLGGIAILAIELYVDRRKDRKGRGEDHA